MLNPRPEIVFPPAYSVGAAELTDPRLASAVLATVALALDYTRIATEHAVRTAADAAEETQWERDRPADVSWRKWARRKRNERDARRSGSVDGP